MSPFSPSAIRARAADWVARRDAGLSRAEAAELQAWLAADPRHRAALERCASAWGALDRPFQAGAADDLLAAVDLRVRRQQRRRMAAAASCVAILFTAGFAWRAVTTPASVPIERHRSGTAVVLLPSIQTLPDGSVVELNTGADITVSFKGAMRRVVLRHGEAHFQVARDETRPFVVAVDNLEVRAVGTAFSVHRGSSKIEVLVTEGRVALDKQVERSAPAVPSAAPSPASVPQTIATLEAGSRTVVNLAPNQQAHSMVETLVAAEVSERLSWRVPRLEFTGTPLAEAVAILNAQAAKSAAPGQVAPRYLIDDPEIGSMRVSGLFRVDNTDSFVRLLKHGFGIEAATRGGSGEIILRKSR